MINAARYSGLLIATFPSFRDEFKAAEGIYVRSHVLAEIANGCIARKDWIGLKKVYDLIERVLKGEPDDDVFNAVHVSVVEHLDFHHSNGKDAMELMPSSVRKACETLQEFSPIPRIRRVSNRKAKRPKSNKKKR